jgi:hypothetical protein
MQYVPSKEIGTVKCFFDTLPEVDYHKLHVGYKEIFYSNVTTYGKLGRNSIDQKAWINSCSFPNAFFRKLAREDFVDPNNPEIKYRNCLTFVETWIDIQLDVNEFFSKVEREQEDIKNIISFTKMISDKLVRLDERIDMVNKIRELIDEENIPISVDPEKGTLDHHSKSKTWREHEVKELMIIIIICKLLFPIMGNMISRLKPIIKDNSSNLNPYCKAIFSGLISKHWYEIHEKLLFYINDKIKKHINLTEITQVFNGISQIGLETTTVAELFTKNFINSDNIGTKSVMGYVDSMIETVIKNKVKYTYQEKTKVAGRKPLQSEENEDSISDLETNSISTKSEFDLIPIVESSIEDCIFSVIDEYGLDSADFYKWEKYYRKNPIIPNMITTTILSGFYNKYISGRSLEYLKAEYYTKLTITMGLAIKEEGYYNLLSIITSSMDSTIKPLDNKLIQKLKTQTNEYNLIQRVFENYDSTFVSSIWKELIKDIINLLSTRKFFYNLHPSVYKTFDTDNVNGGLIPITFDIMNEFYLWIYNRIISS